MKICSGIFLGLMGSICFAQQLFAGTACPLKLEWQPSYDATVTGYAIYYGAIGMPPTNRIDVGLTTAAVVKDLTAMTDYSFFVVAYDSEQIESAPSNFLLYTARVISPLELDRSAGGIVAVLFYVVPGAACHVEYTDTLSPPNWQLLTVATGDSNGLVTVRFPVPRPRGSRFFRGVVP
jgi:Fibronectin type III domain